MSDRIQLYDWDLLTARRPRRVKMLRSLNYIELSVGLAATSLVAWFSTGNVEIFLTIFGLAYFLSIAHAWKASMESVKDWNHREHSQVMDKIWDLEEKYEKCSGSKCMETGYKVTTTSKADF